MTKCILCHDHIKEKLLFSTIFFLKKDVRRVCQSCQNSFEKISDTHCSSCFKEGVTGNCSDCQQWNAKKQTISHESIYSYTEQMAQYFSRYKFQGDYVLRNVFASPLKIHLKKYVDYTIVPIPISQERLDERGFNQVTGLLEAARLSYKTILEKNHIEKQSAKSREERLKLEQPFRLMANVEVPEKILLFDDIYTTGATLQLAKELLMKNGAKKIKTFSLSR